MAYYLIYNLGKTDYPASNYTNVSFAIYLASTNGQSYSGYSGMTISWNVGGNTGSAGVASALSCAGGATPLLASGSYNIGHNVNGVLGTVSASAFFDGSGGFAPPDLSASNSIGTTDYDRSANPPTINTSYRDAAGTTSTIISNVATAKNSGPAATDYNYQWSTNNSTWSGDTAMGSGRTATLSVGKTTAYWYRARAINSDGGWSAYGASAGPFYGFASAPRTLTATPSSSITGRINLSWVAPETTSGGITGYKVYRKLSSSGSYSLVTTLTGTGTTYADEGLSRGVLYDYYVSARNAISDTAGGESDGSTAVTNVRAPGVPTAPTLDTVVASTDTFGKVTLTWTKPTNTAGGIVDYYLYADGAVLASVIGEDTLTGDIIGLNQRQTYSFTVRARNQYAIDNGTVGDISNAINRKSPGTPTAPLNLTSEAPFFPPGTVDLDWDAPTDVGTEGGTITGYNVYLAGGTVPIKTTTGTGTSTTIEDLIPATTYTFFVRARNEIADTVGTFSANSNSTTATAQGEPEAPTGLTVLPDPLVAGRLVLTWIPPVGYNTGFRVYTGAGVLVANIAAPRLEIDGLAVNTSFSYKVRARNPLTDLTGSEGGPFSTTVSGTTGGSSAQLVPNISVANSTNNTFVGTYTLIGTTATTMSYSKTASNINFASVPTNGGTTLNNTNTNLNGTYTIGAPNTTSVTFTKAGSDIAANTSTPSGTMTNNTNVIFNGSYEVLASPAPDPVLKTLSYNKVSSDISTRAASGFVTNNSNAVYNGEYVVKDITETTLVYDRTNDDIEESDAFGVVFNKTNQDIFNGTFTLTDTPDHKTVQYSTGDLTYGENLITNPSMETVQTGTTVLRTNLIANPSFDTNVTGWTTSNSSIARSSDVSIFGTHSALVSPTSNTGSITNGPTISSAGDYTFSAWVYAPEAKNIQIVSGDTFAVPAETWTRISSVLSLGSGIMFVGIASVDSTVPFYVDGVLLEAGDVLKPYFDGASTDELGWNYEWTGTANASTSTAKALSVGGSPAPVDVIGDTATITSSYDQTHSGVLSALVTPSASTGGATVIMDTEAETVYTFSAWIYSSLAKNIQLSADSTTGSVVAIPATTWTRAILSFTASDASTLLSILGTDSTTAFYVDDIMLQESATAQAYFDGDTDDATDTWPVVYTWEGTPHASISIREVGGTLPEVGAEILTPYGEAARVQSDAQLQIRYRSGWLG